MKQIISKLVIIAVAAAVTVMFTGCAAPTGQARTGVNTGIGAGLGTGIGYLAGGKTGALIGGLTGAGAGFGLSKLWNHVNQDERETAELAVNECVKQNKSVAFQSTRNPNLTVQADPNQDMQTAAPRQRWVTVTVTENQKVKSYMLNADTGETAEAHQAPVAANAVPAPLSAPQLTPPAPAPTDTPAASPVTLRPPAPTVVTNAQTVAAQ